MKLVKKIVKYSLLVTLCICLLSCKTTKQSKDKDVPASPETEAVETEKTEKKAAKKEAKAAKKAAKKNKKNISAESGEAETEPSAEGVAENLENAENAELTESTDSTENPGEVTADNAVVEDLTLALAKKSSSSGAIRFIGWDDVKLKKIDYKNGNLRIKTTSKLGNYNISVLSQTGKYIPVLSTRDEYTNSAFYLKADKKIYKLIGNGTVKSQSKKIDSGVALHYTIEDIAEVVISFVTLSSVENQDEDMIKITASVKNIGERITKYSLKTVLDTVLGESLPVHFYTSEGEPVKNEIMYRNFKDCKYIISKNSEAAMYIFLDGKDISPIESFSMANFSTLNIQKWEPDMLSYRTFDTVLDYNNSAVGIEWPEVKLNKDEIADYVFYLGFNVEPNFGNCVKYIWPDESEVKESEIQEVQTPANVSELIKTFDNQNKEAVTEMPVKTPEVPRIVSNSKIDVAQLTKEQLSPEYIQNLLDRIAALEEDDASINQEELIQLNAELDAILEVLKQ